MQYDLVIIGGGSAGLTAVDFVLEMGLKTTIVEKNRIGKTAPGREQLSLRGGVLMVSAGRKPNVSGLDLDNAGVWFSDAGIPVNAR